MELIKWWHDKIIYQIYPKSFKDSNNDGYGDILGIIEKLDYLKYLGVDILWLTPYFKSPMEDNGYDVSDYLDVNEMFGTMQEMDTLIAECKKRVCTAGLNRGGNGCSCGAGSCSRYRFVVGGCTYDCQPFCSAGDCRCITRC